MYYYNNPAPRDWFAVVQLEKGAVVQVAFNDSSALDEVRPEAEVAPLDRAR
jgi:hypothetical protein